MGRLAGTTGLGVLLAGLMATTGHAVHWPAFGGDLGRSGAQPVDVGGLPVTFRHEVGEGPVKTSVVASAGAAEVQRFAYGTTDGRLVVRRVVDGGVVGPAAGTDLSDDANAFGDPATRASVTPVETSTATGLGQVFAVHNDDDGGAGPDIEIAQVDETTGERAWADVGVAGTDGYEVRSSLIATPPAGDGSRVLFFVATDGTNQRLFRVPVTGDARTADARADGAAATSTADVNATPEGSPTLVTIDNLGTETTYVAVGTSDRVRTYRVDDLTPGPVSDPLGGASFTPSVPVQANGQTPGLGQALATSPYVYVAAQTGGSTLVYKLRPGAAGLSVSDVSPALTGAPAPALATDQTASSMTPPAGRLVVTTGANLYVLGTDDLSVTTPRLSGSALTPGTTGFLRTTAAVSGDVAYVTRDDGTQLVLRLSDAQPVDGSDFTQFSGVTTGSTTGIGQPSISRGFVQFGAQDGVFTYRNADLVAPAVTLTAPGTGATFIGSAAFTATASDARGVARVDFRVGGKVVATDTTPEGGTGFADVVDTRTIPNGIYSADAVAVDTSGRTTTSTPVQVTVANPGDPGAVAAGLDRPPTVTFTGPERGTLVRGSATLTATASDDRGVTAVRFLDGTRVLCTDTTAPYTCAYRPTGADVGRRTLTAAAVDTGGQVVSDTRTLVVSRFVVRVSATTTPSRDTRAPFRFTTVGRVRLPAGVTPDQGCRAGRVAIQIKTLRGARTISTKRVRLRANCAFRSDVAFRDAKRFRGSRLTVSVRFLANEVLLPRSATRRTVRVG